MSRKLIALDLLILAVAALLAVQVRREWRTSKAREQAFYGQRVVSKPPPPMAPFVPPPPSTATLYAPVADKNLFSKDRNSNVILDPPAPVKEKPLPPFPTARGVMLWDGVPPTVVLSDRPGGPQKGYHPGDHIGEWQIVSVDNQYLVLGWDGKEFKKRLDELLDKTALTTAEASPAAGNAAPNVVNQAAPKPQVQSLSTSTPEGPGVDIGNGIKACVAGDTSPPGTVAGGLKKVVSQTPFGSACRWEPR